MALYRVHVVCRQPADRVSLVSWGGTEERKDGGTCCPCCFAAVQEALQKEGSNKRRLGQGEESSYYILSFLSAVTSKPPLHWRVGK